MRVWCNGSLLSDPEAPALRVDDHGLTVGDGIFETIRIDAGTPFALTRHLARLDAGAAKLGLPAPDHAQIRGAIDEVLGAEQLDLGRLRITWTGGPGPMGSARTTGAPTLIVSAAAIAPAPASSAVVRVPWARNERSAVTGVKTISFAENVVALAHAQAAGANEALLANTSGLLCEGTGSNVGYVVDGQARTPSLASGCLPGVTRGLILEWGDVVEVDEPIEILDRADEVFLLSTTREVQPVHALDGRSLPAPGPVTEALMRAWAAGVAAGGMDP